MQTSPHTGVSEWAPLVRNIASGDSAAIGKFYQAFSWLKRSFSQRLGADQATDCFHDVILAAVSQIQRGLLRDPARVAGYVRVIASRRVGAEISRMQASRRMTDAIEADVADIRTDAESRVLEGERRAIAGRLLANLPERHREVLVRFYVHGQPPEDIQRALGMTPTQFRLVKSRAKARFATLCEGALARKPAARECLRAQASSAKAS